MLLLVDTFPGARLSVHKLYHDESIKLQSILIRKTTIFASVTEFITYLTNYKANLRVGFPLTQSSLQRSRPLFVECGQGA